MLGEQTIRHAAERQNKEGSLFELYAWYFMRISGVILLVIAVFHLMYMHFGIPGGVSSISHQTIVNRWADPTWGIFWRLFDILLLVFALTHGANGVRNILNEKIRRENRRIGAQIILLVVYITLLVMGNAVILAPH